MIGISSNWKREALMGLLYGIVFIGVNKLYPQFMLGIPKQIIFGGYFFTVCVVAPILEEAGFRGILLSVFSNQPMWIRYGIVSVAFSIFHWQAYGLALSTAFIGAFIFSLISCFISENTNSLTTAIVMHGIFNWWMTQGAQLFFMG